MTSEYSIPKDGDGPTAVGDGEGQCSRGVGPWFSLATGPAKHDTSHLSCQPVSPIDRGVCIVRGVINVS